SYIRTSGERGSFYHEKVRNQMLRYLQTRKPKDLNEAHVRLAEYFIKEQERLGLKEKAAYKSESWRKSEYERIYHLISSQPDKNIFEAVNAFLHAFRWQWGVADEVIEACQQIEKEKNISAIRDIVTT